MGNPLCLLRLAVPTVRYPTGCDTLAHLVMSCGACEIKGWILPRGFQIVLHAGRLMSAEERTLEEEEFEVPGLFYDCDLSVPARTRTLQMKRAREANLSFHGDTLPGGQRMGLRSSAAALHASSLSSSSCHDSCRCIRPGQAEDLGHGEPNIRGSACDHRSRRRCLA